MAERARWRMRDRTWAILASAYLVLCVLLGGASAAGAAANGFLQLLALVLIVLIAWTRWDAPAPPGTRTLVAIVAAYLVWALAQLVPVPASLWASLPGRAPISGALAAMGAAPGSMPLSLNPQGTVQSLLSLLPPVAAFLLVLRLPSRGRRTVAVTVVGIALVSILLGVFQLLAGEGSPLRPYRITNPGAPVGFFANKNHLATLLLCSLPLVAALAGAQVARERDSLRKNSRLVIYGSLALFLTVGLAINESLAGYVLLVPAMFVSALIYQRTTTGRISPLALGLLGLLAAGFVAVAFAGPLSTEQFSSKLTDQPASRRVMTATTVEAAKDFFPVGTGLGSFQQVYRTYEDPATVSRGFANHAHNDHAEIALELGLPGILLVLLFALWWARWTVSAWRGDFSGIALARAASAILGLVLMHSFVDYPIRTSAVAALFAAACALLLPAPRGQAGAAAREAAEAPAPGARHLKAE